MRFWKFEKNVQWKFSHLGNGIDGQLMQPQLPRSALYIRSFLEKSKLKSAMVGTLTWQPRLSLVVC